MQIMFQQERYQNINTKYDQIHKRRISKPCKYLKILCLIVVSHLLTIIITTQYLNSAEDKEITNPLQNKPLIFQEDRIKGEVNPTSISIFKNFESKFESLKRFQDSKYIQSFEELPLCLLVPQQPELMSVLASIQKQNYHNFKVIVLSKQKLKTKLPHEKEKWTQNSNYYDLKDILLRNCKPTDLLFVIKAELVNQEALNQLNIQFQIRPNWAVTSQVVSLKKFQVIACYVKVYLNIETNDFDKSNQQFLKDSNFDMATIAIYEMVPNHVSKLSIGVFFKKDPSSIKLLSAFMGNNVQYIYEKRTKYQVLYSMSQTYQINEEQVQAQLNILKKGKALRQPKDNNMTHQKMSRGFENVEMKNLPFSHFLFGREKFLFERDYNISSYKKEPPMCVVVLSNNNIDHDRYKKVMDTIKMQLYSNYKIVFIDDVSTDDTFNATKRYVKQIGIPDSKIQFIKNEQRKYATYNLKNAAFNYCDSRDIFVIVDGDDELIGRLAFKLISIFYLKNNGHNWIVFTNYITSMYTLGASYIIPEEYKASNDLYRKFPRHLMGPIRTFYTALFRKIKDRDHKFDDGNYFDTMYDEAMQEPMLEMAGYHAEYIPQICYFYNKMYGNSDNSTPQKKKHKKETYQIILSRKPYEKLNTLFD